MKVEIEIPDIQDLYYSEYECDEVTVNDFKKAIVEEAINRMIEQLYKEYVNDATFRSIRDDVGDLVKEKSGEIVERVVDKVSEEILRKKSIVEEMPKKSEVANISKEWEAYFIELIDKAIAKRFK